MAKRKKKTIPIINGNVGREKTVTIETDDFSFDITYKVPGASSVLSLMIDGNSGDNADGIDVSSLGSGLVGILSECITSWTIEGPISKESIDGLPMPALAGIFSEVVSGLNQEKN